MLSSLPLLIDPPRAISFEIDLDPIRRSRIGCFS